MLIEFVQSITGFIEQLVLNLGPPGIVLVALFENLFPPTPSEFLYPLAGKLAYDGKITILAVVIAGVLGSLLGSFIFYMLGYRYGERGVKNFIQRFGKIRIGRWQYQVFSPDDYDRAGRLFENHGAKIIYIARLMPFVHGIVSLPAGVMRMPLPKFVLYTVLGSGTWVGFLTILGYILGQNWEQLLDWIRIYENVWYIVIGLVVLYWIYRRVQSRRVS